MFSRVLNASRATGQTVVRAGRRTFNSSSSANAGRRAAGFLTVAGAGTGLALTMAYDRQQAAFCGAAPAAKDERKNTAFIFIKPHAVTAETKALVSEGLKAKGIKILREGTLSAKEIDDNMLIDNHYYAIASKATLLKPNQLNVPAEKFKAQFGVGWQESLDKGVVYNAKDACEKLGLDAAGINAEWAKAKKANKLVKFGGGFYCGLIDTVPNQAPIYVFNGFFMNMRSDYVRPGASLHYYVVEWDSKKLSWSDFRGEVLGPTDPVDAPADSLRGLIMSQWKRLGLKSQPNVGDNGVHASASPFEALAERMNWLGVKLADDDFGKALLNAGVSADTIKTWSVDPVVTYGADSQPIVKSLFDSLEDTDSDMCLARAMMINGKQSRLDPVQIGLSFTLGAALAALAGKAI